MQSLDLAERITAAVTWLVIKFLAVLSGILMAQAIAALYAAPHLHPADLPKKLLQSIMMISLSFVIAGIFYFTYEYRFKRLLVTIRRPFKPLTRYMASYAASAEARAAKKIRYAWLRKRARKLASGVLWN
jgi:glucan phosphoethanolaminetransferase (alkaline phosphatase superfamily)